MSKGYRARREFVYSSYEGDRPISTLAIDNAAQKSNFLVRYPTVRQVVGDFEEAHLRIIQDATDEEFAAEDAIRDEFDRMRFAVIGRYETLTAAERAAAQQSSRPAPTSAIKLPKIDLPKFEGDLALWPSFIALFDTAIHENSGVADIQKFQYLLASLSGETLGVVKNLPLTAENYVIAYDALRGRYQNRRKLATHYWRAFAHAKPLVADTAESLRALLDVFTENTRALQMMGYPVEAWDFVLLNHLLEKLTPTLREKFEATHMRSEPPRYEQLTTFLAGYCTVLAAVADASPQSNKSKAQNQSSRRAASTTSLVAQNAACPKCGEHHLLAKCPEFLKLSTKDRHNFAREKGLCLNCLRAGHNLKSCPSSWACRSCQAKHHSLLHFERANVPPAATAPAVPPAVSDTVAPASAVEKPIISMASISSRVVLLSTVRAEALDATATRFRHRATVLGVNDTKTATTRGITLFVVRARDREDLRFPIEATVLSRITSPLPHTRVDAKSWSHLRGLPLADPEYHLPDSVDILLGADSFVSVLRDGRRTGRTGEPDAFNTAFGWVLMGAISPSLREQPVHSLATTIESN
ncbi:uncharacterized protein [Temnothorax longispinosus]|uniref:uncharacterized protein n=1 Tax=Temnothorax longispinosus TaxID=300112 RepID=UPI003A9A596C